MCLKRGDTAICVFPCRGPAASSKSPRPGLVVAVRSLGGTTFVDLAPGTPHDQAPVAPHEVVVVEPRETALAGLTKPTRFDLRRRILVKVSDKGRLHRRLGSLGTAADLRLAQSMQFAGDVSPLPVGESSRGRRNEIEGCSK